MNYIVKVETSLRVLCFKNQFHLSVCTYVYSQVRIFDTITELKIERAETRAARAESSSAIVLTRVYSQGMRRTHVESSLACTDFFFQASLSAKVSTCSITSFPGNKKLSYTLISAGFIYALVFPVCYEGCITEVAMARNSSERGGREGGMRARQEKRPSCFILLVRPPRS